MDSRQTSLPPLFLFFKHTHTNNPSPLHVSLALLYLVSIPHSPPLFSSLTPFYSRLQLTFVASYQGQYSLTHVSFGILSHSLAYSTGVTASWGLISRWTHIMILQKAARRTHGRLGSYTCMANVSHWMDHLPIQIFMDWRIWLNYGR
jgi:hypothetical protein